MSIKHIISRDINRESFMSESIQYFLILSFLCSICLVIILFIFSLILFFSYSSCSAIIISKHTRKVTHLISFVFPSLLFPNQYIRLLLIHQVRQKYLTSEKKKKKKRKEEEKNLLRHTQRATLLRKYERPS